MTLFQILTGLFLALAMLALAWVLHKANSRSIELDRKSIQKHFTLCGISIVLAALTMAVPSLLSMGHGPVWASTQALDTHLVETSAVPGNTAAKGSLGVVDYKNGVFTFAATVDGTVQQSSISTDDLELIQVTQYPDEVISTQIIHQKCFYRTPQKEFSNAFTEWLFTSAYGCGINNQVIVPKGALTIIPE